LKGPKGDYIKGRIEHIDAIPVGDTSTDEEAVENRLTEDDCRNWGQHGLSAAS